MQLKLKWKNKHNNTLMFIPSVVYESLWRNIKCLWRHDSEPVPSWVFHFEFSSKNHNAKNNTDDDDDDGNKYKHHTEWKKGSIEKSILHRNMIWLSSWTVIIVKFVPYSILLNEKRIPISSELETTTFYWIDVMNWSSFACIHTYIHAYIHILTLFQFQFTKEPAG